MANEIGTVNPANPNYIMGAGGKWVRKSTTGAKGLNPMTPIEPVKEMADAGTASSLTNILDNKNILGDMLVDFDLGNLGTIPSDVFGGMKTNVDINKLLADQATLRESLISSLKPTAEENQFSQQLADIQNKIQTSNLSTKAGIQAAGQRVAPRNIVLGEQRNIAEQGQLELQTLGIEESNLLNRLGLAQEARQASLNATQVGLSLISQDLDLQFKVQQAIDTKEQQLFQNVMTLRTDAQNRLGTILKSFEGLTFDKLDTQTQLQLATLAQQVGIPVDILKQGMEVVADKLELEKLKNADKPITQVVDGKLLQYDPATKTWATIYSSGDSDRKIVNINGVDYIDDGQGNYKIPEVPATPVNPAVITSLNEKMATIDELINSKGLDNAVGTSGFIGRWSPLEFITGEKGDFIAGVQSLISQETLDTLLELKKAGGTLGAISEKELEILQNAATKINEWAVKDDETGKVKGYKTSHESFKNELERIKTSTKNILEASKGTSTSAVTNPTDVLDNYYLNNPTLRSQIDSLSGTYTDEEVLQILGVPGFQEQINAPVTGNYQGLPMYNTLAVNSGNRSDRNNNPGNIKVSDYTKSFPGVAGVESKKADDGGYFLVFKTPQDGINAVARLLKSGKSYQGVSAETAIKRYNGGGAYGARTLGLNPIQDFQSQLQDPNKLNQVVLALLKAEGYTGNLS